MKQFFLVLAMGVAIMSCSKKDDDNAAPFLNFNLSSLSIPPVSGATAELIVESNIEWQVSSGADWLQFNKTSGKESDTIRITVIKTNESAQARNATITAVPVNSSINLQAQATIEQKPYNVQLIAQKNFGGAGGDFFSGITGTSDGGVLLSGSTTSNKSGDVGTNHGGSDAWIVRLNSNRDTVWSRVMGGTGDDVALNAISASDGGFIVAGYTGSNNTGDVGSNKGGTDWWIIKLKSNGDTAWTRMLGGAYGDFAVDIAATADGGFVVVGEATFAINGTGSDVVIVKFDSNGNTVWQKTYGGSSSEWPTSISVASNGAIFVASATSSNNSGDVGPTKGTWDYWILKLKANGDKEWAKNFGGSNYDTPNRITCTSDGGAVVSGLTNSSQTGDVGTSHGDYDVWVIKINGSGDIVWNKLFGGTGSDSGSDVLATPGDGYLLAATTNSKDGDVGATQGNDDLWMLRLNGNGQVLWSKTFGGQAADYIYGMSLSSDGSFYAAGYTESNTKGSSDGWLLKLKDY